MRQSSSSSSSPSLFYWILLFSSVGFALTTLIFALLNYQRTTQYLIGEDAPVLCNDDDACTRDTLFSIKGTCRHEPYKEGHDCTDEDVCYNTSGTNQRKQCCKGECIANRSLCIGVCQSNNDCYYDMFPVDYSQIPYYELSCIQGGTCTLVTIQYVLSLGIFDQPFLFNVSRCGSSSLERRSKCIQVHCDQSIYESICIYRYKCAKSSTFIPDNVMTSKVVKGEGNDLHPLLVNRKIPNYFNDYMNKEQYDRYNSNMKGILNTLLRRANVSNVKN